MVIEWKANIINICKDYCDDTWFLNEQLKQPHCLKSKSAFDFEINPIIEAAQKLGAVYIPSEFNQFVPYQLCDYKINNKQMYLLIDQNSKLINENISKNKEYQNLNYEYQTKLQTKYLINVLLSLMLLFNITFIVYYSFN